jgi:hypothetical protein
MPLSPLKKIHIKKNVEFKELYFLKLYVSKISREFYFSKPGLQRIFNPPNSSF